MNERRNEGKEWRKMEGKRKWNKRNWKEDRRKDAT